jgi:4-hydroxy-2-oxoheptanedioate aldolase
MVNTAAEAKALTDACMYPPLGKRSNGPIRAAMYGEASSYQATANNEILVIPMIETQAGVDNIDEILSVPGISGIYIGPSDLGLSLGMIPILDREEPVILGIYEKLLASCKKHGKWAGLHNGTAAYAGRMIQMGFQLTTIANDSGLMARAAREAVTATRKAGGPAAN